MTDKEKIIEYVDKLLEKYPKNYYLLTVAEFIDNLETTGVDLKKHLKEDIEDVFFDLNGVAVKGATHYLTVGDVKELAKHFFELGLKARKKKSNEQSTENP